jgi:ABC-type dipeptide/oligopeptide/nickel transport system ATPase component
MPPKKKKEIDLTKPVKFYTIMNKKFLTKTENPNYHLHRFNLPFIMCIVAPSGSGKTIFLVNLINLFCQGRGTFVDINISTKNKDEPLYNYLASMSDQTHIREGEFETLPKLDDFDKEAGNHLVVVDDLVLGRNQERICNYFIRKLNVSVINISQTYYGIPPIIRKNTSYMVLLKLNGKRDINAVLGEVAAGLTKEQLLAMHEYATNEKFNALVV